MTQRMSASLSLLLFLLIFSECSFGQVNAYAKVTAISGGSTVLTLSDVNETYHTFEDGEYIIIMQMQDDVIGDVTNSSTFGTLGSINSAGLYEVGIISTHTESSGLPTTITLTKSLTNTYNIGANSSVQIISYRLYGSPNYTTTANMTALDWDGNVGGVLALRVTGTLTIAHNLTADGAGFRGGARSGTGGTVTCSSTSWITSTSGDAGRKGEGIHKNTSGSYQLGRAKILVGGGGGAIHNAGGGGGGNYTAGGDGGPGYTCSATPVGGQGGISLSSVSSASRIFMGGGGGGGQQNNANGTAGADGGGIILIKANQIRTTGSSGTLNISASGASAANANNDGAGGGGAGGTIVFDVASYSIAAGTPLAVSANGGTGGTSQDGTVHGGGGAGGQGRVIYSTVQPTTNITTSTNNGAAGCNNNSSPCGSAAGSASGANNNGIAASTGTTPLPVKYSHFSGYYDADVNAVNLEWVTTMEVNNDYFSIERSDNGTTFFPVGTVRGAGTTQESKHYTFVDREVDQKRYYYRIAQVDFDQTKSYSKVISVAVDNLSSEQPSFVLYPNPASGTDEVFVKVYNSAVSTVNIKVQTARGETVFQKTAENTEQGITMPTPQLTKGIYLVTIQTGTWKSTQKLFVY